MLHKDWGKGTALLMIAVPENLQAPEPNEEGEANGIDRR